MAQTAIKKLMKRFLIHFREGKVPLYRKFLLDLLEEKQGAVVLDVGCGDGEFTRQVADKVQPSEIFGIEIVKQYATKARKENGITVVVADADREFPFGDESFDLVVSNQVIEHLSDTDNFVKEVYRVLRQGGYCVIATSNLASPFNIISLMLGYQPPVAHVSDEVICGNPFDPERGQVFPPPPARYHRRIFTALALKDLFLFHGFQSVSVKGWGLHPLPLFISKHVRWPRYAAVLAVRATKL